MGIQAFADILGPVWKAKDEVVPGTYTAYVAGNDLIIPWQDDALVAPPLNGEVLCDWIAEDDDEYDKIVAISSASNDTRSNTFDGTETLLIRALKTGETTLAVNTRCQAAIGQARTHLKDKGRLCVAGTMKPYFYNDSATFGLQAGYGGANAAMARQYKRAPGQSLKNVLVELWAMQTDMRDPELLNDLCGLEVSLCTSTRNEYGCHIF